MTRLAVAGATGAMGELIVQAAEEDGFTVVPLSRSQGVDLLSADGLDAKLEGVSAVIDASQVVSPVAEDPVAPILKGADNLVGASRSAGVDRLIMLSINGVQDEGLRQFPFYDARSRQEEVVADSGLAHTIVRSSQWFEFALNPAAVVEEDDVVRAQNWQIQPAAALSVARYVVRAAAGEHGDGVVTVCGPDRMRLPELTEAVLRHRGDERPVTIESAPLPGMDNGSLLAPADADLVGPALGEWLDAQNQRTPGRPL
ncbi:MAG: NAD(P)H-binding protein [Kocuria sp.]|nr:NAD(P)H-binding protein [Kocuria sp.]MDN5617868.1 NAD(P)H-binding protein [Kocuria sp.]MDN5654180.1 NAD(P)H-binding protein [Kocuria sp.]